LGYTDGRNLAHRYAKRREFREGVAEKQKAIGTAWLLGDRILFQETLYKTRKKKNKKETVRSCTHKEGKKNRKQKKKKRVVNRKNPSGGKEQ